jgi:hypothetical protein
VPLFDFLFFLMYSQLQINPKIQQAEMIDCRKCRHYYVTWDKNYPHGCKAMKFKSKQLPSIDVRISSHRECLLISKKENVKEKTS